VLTVSRFSVINSPADEIVILQIQSSYCSLLRLSIIELI
jgi:hypothetical protein